MTNIEIIQAIRAEIERRHAEWQALSDKGNISVDGLGAKFEDENILSFLSTLKSEKPVPNDLDFEQELYNHFGQVKDFTLGMRIGQYFYELGCRRTAEKYDEIEYNRQQAEEQVCDNFQSEYERYIASRKDGLSCHNVSVNIKDMAEHFAQWGAEHLADARKTLPKDLEEAAREYGFEEYRRRCNGGEYGTSEDAFIAGAKWMEEQLKK